MITDIINSVNFDKMNGLLPAVVQDANTRSVLMVGYMNQAALEQTITTEQVTFYSRSKERLWVKGETSGNYLQLVDVAVDCDGDALLVLAHPQGPVCHTGSTTCFGDRDIASRFDLYYLERLIQARVSEQDPNSYTNRLFNKGINKVAQKVGEEAVEVVIEAMSENPQLFLEEAADLVFHYLILLNAKGTSLAEVVKVLEGRNQIKTSQAVT